MSISSQIKGLHPPVHTMISRRIFKNIIEKQEVIERIEGPGDGAPTRAL